MTSAFAKQFVLEWNERNNREFVTISEDILISLFLNFTEFQYILLTHGSKCFEHAQIPPPNPNE